MVGKLLALITAVVHNNKKVQQNFSSEFHLNQNLVDQRESFLLLPLTLWMILQKNIENTHGDIMAWCLCFVSEYFIRCCGCCSPQFSPEQRPWKYQEKKKTRKEEVQRNYVGSNADTQLGVWFKSAQSDSCHFHWCIFLTISSTCIFVEGGKKGMGDFKINYFTH